MTFFVETEPVGPGLVQVADRRPDGEPFPPDMFRPGFLAGVGKVV